MRDDAVDGEEFVVPRVPSLPCDSARQSTEHKLTGHGSVQKLVSPLRSSEGSSSRTRFPGGRRVARTSSLVVTEKMCCRSCVSNAEAVQLDAWERQLWTGRERRTTRVRS